LGCGEGATDTPPADTPEDTPGATTLEDTPGKLPILPITVIVAAKGFEESIDEPEEDVEDEEEAAVVLAEEEDEVLEEEEEDEEDVEDEEEEEVEGGKGPAFARLASITALLVVPSSDARN
jgi:hypothetical protein